MRREEEIMHRLEGLRLALENITSSKLEGWAAALKWVLEKDNGEAAH